MPSSPVVERDYAKLRPDDGKPEIGEGEGKASDGESALASEAHGDHGTMSRSYLGQDDDNLRGHQPHGRNDDAPATPPAPDEFLTVSVPCTERDVDAIDAWLGGSKPASGRGVSRPDGDGPASGYDWLVPDMAGISRTEAKPTKSKASDGMPRTGRHQHPDGKLASSSLSEEGEAVETGKDEDASGGDADGMDGRQDGTDQGKSRTATSDDGTDATSGKRESILSGISMSQVTAGALAAVTSLLLSSQIGIAGSVIGVAVASVISTVSGQVYRVMLSRSAGKLKAMAQAAPINIPIIGDTEADEDATDGEPGIDATMTSAEIPEELSFHDGVTERVPKVGETQPRTSGGRGGAFKTQPVGGVGNWDIERNGVRVAPKALRVAAAEREREDTKRKVIAVTVVASLAAVLLTAGIITLATNGNGLGEKTPSIVQTVTGGNGMTVGSANVPNGVRAVNANASATDDANADTAGNEGVEADGHGKRGYGNGRFQNQDTSTANDAGNTSEDGQGTPTSTVSPNQDAKGESDGSDGTQHGSGDMEPDGKDTGSTGDSDASSSGGEESETGGGTPSGNSNATGKGDGTGAGNANAGTSTSGEATGKE